VIDMSILDSLLTHKVTLCKVTSSGGTDIWGEPSETITQYTIDAYIQPITVEDIRVMSPGEFSFGDARGYFKTKYDVETKEVEVRPGDQIIYNDVTYLVESVSDFQWNEFKYREAYLRRVT